ncbi:MAG TPA: lytic transglycosylase domain-containing protein [Candidatus Krumholzibacteria bacterium]|nr:lytic transglycosylase domain-containing protein [Candidatus Krumholzibacteria bacterium]
MLRRLAIAALVAAIFFAAALRVPAPHATRNPALPEVHENDAVRRARLLDRHGEPGLAWESLRAGAAGDNPQLAVRLLTELGRFPEADSLLAGMPPALLSGEQSAFFHQIHRARLNYEAGRFATALEILDAEDIAAAAGADPALAAYRSYLLARVHLARSEPEAAQEALVAARAGTPPQALVGLIDEERVAVSRALGRAQEALAAAGDAVESAENSRARRAMMLTRYELAWECGDDAAAIRAARQLFDGARGSEEAGRCAADLLQRTGSEAPPSVLLDCAETLAACGDGTSLRRALRILDQRQLGTHDAETHRLLWSEYHYQTGDWSRAIALARPSYSDVSLRRRSMLIMARSLRKMGSSGEAAALYEQFARAYPNDALAAEALFAAASLYERDRQPRESDRVRDQLRRSYPSTFHGWAAAMRRAGDFSQDGGNEQAIAIYEQWLVRSQRTDEAALFYLARERDRAQAGSGLAILDELRRLNPFSFYVSPDVVDGSRGPLMGSSGQILRAGPGSLSEWLDETDAARGAAYARVLAAAGTPSGNADLETDRIIARAALFLDAGLRDWAERELDVARRRSGGSAAQTLLLARLYEDYAMPWRSVRLYERARTSLSWDARRERAEDFRFLTHPLPYPAQVLDSAARNGVPAHLVYGMIREESRFEADVVSRAGAVGLMQLMPQTARRLAAQMDLSQDVDQRLDDPAINVSLGVWYAADLLRAGKGSVAWMLAAYNAGPNAAERWLEPGASGDAAIAAVESIDYKETRGYVKRVIESANVYQSLYFGHVGTGSGSH